MNVAGIYKDQETGGYYFSPAVIERVVAAVLREHRLDGEYARLTEVVMMDLLAAALDADGVPLLKAKLDVLARSGAVLHLRAVPARGGPLREPAMPRGRAR